MAKIQSKPLSPKGKEEWDRIFNKEDKEKENVNNKENGKEKL